MFRFLFLLCSFLFFSFIIRAQISDITTPSSGENIIVGSIVISGNKITKQHIVLREVPFLTGDTIKKDDISKLLVSVRENLLNTSLFNFVRIDTIPALDNKMNFLINVTERWYTWPFPIFEVQERNFNTWWQTKNFDRANYGFYLSRENFRGRKEDLSFYFQFGYTEKYGISYKIPYLNKKRTSGAGFSMSYARNREVGYMTNNHILIYFKNPDEYVRTELIGKLNYTYRSGIHDRHYLECRFTRSSINDTLLNYTKDYFLNSGMAIKYFTFEYSVRSDHRDSKTYPLQGYFMDFEIVKLGLGILPDEKINVSNFYFSFKKYGKLDNRLYLSGGMRVKASPTRDQPYYVQKGLGWSDYVRGYEYYVIDGQNYVLGKTGIRYEIIKPKIHSIPYIPFKKFNTFHYAIYAGIFGDAGYVDDRKYSLLNPLANTFIYGFGAGIDYVTYYDIVLRFEYSFNKRMEHGFFVNFNVGI